MNTHRPIKLETIQFVLGRVKPTQRLHQSPQVEPALVEDAVAILNQTQRKATFPMQLSGLQNATTLPKQGKNENAFRNAFGKKNDTPNSVAQDCKLWIFPNPKQEMVLETPRAEKAVLGPGLKLQLLWEVGLVVPPPASLLTGFQELYTQRHAGLHLQ